MSVSRLEYRGPVEGLLDEWSEDSTQAKNLINCLVGFLSGDFYWLNKNISQVDREILVGMGRMLMSENSHIKTEEGE